MTIVNMNAAPSCVNAEQLAKIVTAASYDGMMWNRRQYLMHLFHEIANAMMMPIDDADEDGKFLTGHDRDDYLRTVYVQQLNRWNEKTVKKLEKILNEADLLTSTPADS